MSNRTPVPPPANAPKAAIEKPDELRPGFPEATNLGQAIEADMQTEHPQVGGGSASSLLDPAQVAALGQMNTKEVDALAADKLAHASKAKQSEPAKDKQIEVRALRAGYFKGSRKSEGDVFTVPAMEDLGTWMEPTDKGVMESFKKLTLEKAAKQAAQREIREMRARR